jgi:hypothetical protein
LALLVGGGQMWGVSLTLTHEGGNGGTLSEKGGSIQFEYRRSDPTFLPAATLTPGPNWAHYFDLQGYFSFLTPSVRALAVTLSSESAAELKFFLEGWGYSSVIEYLLWVYSPALKKKKPKLPQLAAE